MNLTENRMTGCAAGVPVESAESCEQTSERERTAEGWRASEERYRTLFEHAPDGIFIADAGNCYIDANASMCWMLGYTREEFIGSHTSDILVAGDGEHFDGALAALRAGSNYHQDWQFRRKNGSVFAAEVIATVMPDGNVLAMVRDITGRKRVEESLKVFRSLVDQSDDIFEVIDPETARFLDVTARGCIDLGYTRAEHLRLRVFDIDPHVKESDWPELVEKMRAEGSLNREGRHRRKDGSTYPVELTAKWIRLDRDYIVAVVRDITARKQAEDVLWESERRFREMLERVELIAIILDRKGTVTFCNDYLLKVTGWSREEVIGADWSSTFIPATSVAAKKLLLEVIDAGEMPAHYSNPIQTRTGELREIAWNNTTLRDPAGNISGTASLGEDVTERRQAELRVRQKEEAERANRAKSEFLSRMSHELRTPLNAMLGFAQLLGAHGQSPEDAECVAQIVRAGKHLIGVINEVLDIAHVESGKLVLTSEPVDVRESLEEALSLMKPLAAERRVRFAPLAGELDCAVLASPQHLTQVILNLLSNSVKYNREGGSVAICGERMEDRLRIKVADTGRGISHEDMEKVFVSFERFETGGREIEGTGLGLSLSKHLVEAMGGTIGVDSVFGQGTTFWVELPLIPPAPAQTTPGRDAPASVFEAPLRTLIPRTLLYIEDNLSNLRLVGRILARRPEVKLISAMQGSIALDLARQHQPDLILLDLHLPDIQGDEILGQLRGDPRTARIPIVMISADAIPAQIERLRAAGADDYLTKPIDVRKLLTLVDTLPCDSTPTGPPDHSPHAATPNASTP